MALQQKIFQSSLALPPEEVSSVLRKKIEEENLIVERHSTKEAIKFEEELFSNINFTPNQINIVSLFSGAGGLDLGVELAYISASHGEKIAYESLNDKKSFEKLLGNVKIIYSNDLFKSANQTYIKNFNNDLVKDSRDIRQVISFPKSNLILGGFPCPGFSAAGPRLLDDPRNFLYIHYIRALMKSQPEFFIAENVKGLMTMGKGQVISQMTEDFAAAGYQVTAHLVNAKHYGVPQSRERVFIIGVRNDIVETYGFEYKLPEPTHGTQGTPFVTLEDAIGDLPLEAQDVFDSDYSSMYMSRNRKKSWTDQSFTIQASGRQAPQHPAGDPMVRIGKDQWEFRGHFNRRLSVRECARIQTFPDWFTFSDGNNEAVSKNNRLNEQYKQIGNAVPVILAEKIGRPILEFLAHHVELNNSL